MNVIKPTIITDSMLVSSNITEDDYAPWNAATNYVVGDEVIRTTSSTHKIYENLIAGVHAGPPEDNTAGVSPRWLDLGATNRWKMFDSKVGSASSNPTEIIVVLTPGSSVSGIAALDLIGSELEITVKDVPGGSIVYNKVMNLDGTIITSFFEWFYTPYDQLTDVTLTDLPDQYFNPEITFNLSALSGTVQCGTYSIGNVFYLGQSQYGASVGIISYSVKTTDIYGVTTVIKRKNSKRNSLKLMTEQALFNRTYKVLSELDSIPCIYIGTNAVGYEPTIVYGFWKDFSIDISYPTTVLTNIEIEGLT